MQDITPSVKPMTTMVFKVSVIYLTPSITGSRCSKGPIASERPMILPSFLMDRYLPIIVNNDE